MSLEDHIGREEAFRAGVSGAVEEWLEANRRDVLAAIREAFRPEDGIAPAAPADWRAAVPKELHRELADAILAAHRVRFLAGRNEADSFAAGGVANILEKIAAMIARPGDGDDDAGP